MERIRDWARIKLLKLTVASSVDARPLAVTLTYANGASAHHMPRVTAYAAGRVYVTSTVVADKVPVGRRVQLRAPEP
jgi:hypothetical protein